MAHTTKSDGNVFDDLGLPNADLLLRIADQDIEIERLRAALEDIVHTMNVTATDRQFIEHLRSVARAALEDE